MRTNKSPWIHQLDKDRKSIPLTQDIETDIAIVGAGIAGISTAFFLLKYTNKKVVILERGRLAHGATGHNAGQVVAYFERPLEELVQEFGFEKTKRAIHDYQSGWIYLDEMYTDANLDILFSRVVGCDGFSDIHQTLLKLKNTEIEVMAGLQQDEILISETAPFLDLIPSTYKHLYKTVPQAEILKRLETEDASYHGAIMDQRGCMNSALFCQEVLRFLQKKYAKRFSLYENTHIGKVVLKKNHALLDAGNHTVGAERVVLCTNGFENFEIFNEDGLGIDKNFHHSVVGKVGYMSGYLENMNKTPAAIVYLGADVDPSTEDPYYYMTRRPHELGDEKHNLICVGGPEVEIKDREEYLYDYDYPETMHQDIDGFIRRTYDKDPNRKINYEFTWHGLMGYTPSRVRLIGTEPKNPVLLYNLGCNGVGLIPSIFGGRRITRMIAGERLAPSIFDPRT